MSKPKLKLSIAHQVPGRVRMKIPSAKGNTELLQQISETFAVIPGIEQVTVNPVTGSVVLHYDVERHDEFHGRFRDHHGHVQSAPPPTQIDEFANKIEEEAEFLARNSESARAVVDFCKKLDQEIKKATGNSVDLKIVFAIAIIGVTVFEIGATAATPVWVTLAIFAVNHFIEMHAPGMPNAAAMAPVVIKGASPVAAHP
jgi:Heavy metal associated domain 2